MIEVKKISPTKKNLRKFTQFQIDLYRGNGCYVPPLISDDVKTLDPKENPAFDFCEAQCFMAYEDGRPVGRVAAIINNAVNERSGEKSVRFGFLDFEDNPEVSAALMKAVEQWGTERGMTRVRLDLPTECVLGVFVPLVLRRINPTGAGHSAFMMTFSRWTIWPVFSSSKSMTAMPS